MAKRKERPEPRWQQRMAAAHTPADQLAAANDRLRVAAKRMQRPQRDLTARQADTERAGQLLTATAEYANTLAAAMESGEHDYRRSDAA